MLDPTRAASLRLAKLTALVADHVGIAPDPVDLAGAPAVAHGGELFVLAADRRILGGALVWAARRSAERLHIVAENDGGILARRAAHWSIAVAVSEIDGRTLRTASPAPLAAPVALAEAHRAWRDVIVAAGAEPVEEHGVLSGEVGGLEVCRVVDGPAGEGARLEVGIGADDREIFALLHADRPVGESLAEVVAMVGALRAAGPVHPLARLAPERGLRARLVAEPHLVGAVSVAPVPPPQPRVNLTDPAPCAAIATMQDATRVAVVCSAGVDLDAVPVAVDVGLMTGLPCTLVVAARNAVPAQRQLAALAVPPIALVALGP